MNPSSTKVGQKGVLSIHESMHWTGKLWRQLGNSRTHHQPLKFSKHTAQSKRHTPFLWFLIIKARKVLQVITRDCFGGGATLALRSTSTITESPPNDADMDGQP
ncbi:hypothetical protein SESBI_15972 [Sesbania bispinosa]|nr:hypothetical protein SESBI_15972 [Sesbania bispinosa]